MDYFNEAFGGFRPQSDEDAALKFSLNVILMDDRLSHLIESLSPSSKIGGFEGVPGWLLEWRHGGETRGYENWPDLAMFRAYVDPQEFRLEHPEFFCDCQTFYAILCSAIKAYLERHPNQAPNIETALSSSPNVPSHFN
ncbi:MAG: hypothetical protein U0P46_03450 [Holophagaceae bacterium]